MSTLFLASLVETAQDIGNTLKFDTPKFVAQLLTFVIVYFVLSKFAFGPALSMLEARRKRIEEGEANLKKIKSDLEGANTQAAEIRAKAEADATRIIKEAQDAGNQVKESKAQEAISEATSILAKAREAATLDRERTMAELKSEFGRLVVNTASKVTGKVLTGDDHQRINQEAMTQISR
jgi:F-type H+-transporting ATPase subunit b